MRLVLFLFVNIAIADALSEWTSLNSGIINSKSYKISCSQHMEIGMESSSVLSSDILELIYLNDNVKLESNSKISIINQDSVKMLNKHSNQIFIDNSNEFYKMLLSMNLAELLLLVKPFEEVYPEDYFLNSDEDIYAYLDQREDYDIRIFFRDKDLAKITFTSNEYVINFHDIKISLLDEKLSKEFFSIGNNFSQVFDLRVK